MIHDVLLLVVRVSKPIDMTTSPNQEDRLPSEDFTLSRRGEYGILLLKVRVTLNARKTIVTRIDAETFEVDVDEEPECGRANRRLLEIMSEHLRVPKSRLALVAGARSRDKVILIAR